MFEFLGWTFAVFLFVCAVLEARLEYKRWLEETSELDD
jgi:hypothetical protein